MLPSWEDLVVLPAMDSFVMLTLDLSGKRSPLYEYVISKSRGDLDSFPCMSQ